MHTIHFKQPLQWVVQLRARHTGPHRTDGFSLLELIVVVGIMFMVAGLSLPAIGSAKRAMDLRSGVSRVLDELTIAHQTACTRNLPVEVRFYCDDTAGSSAPDSVALFAIQSDGSARAVQKRSLLPETVKISRSTKFSSLFPLCGTAVAKPGDTIKSQSFRFLPNGTTNLTGSDSPTLTLFLRADEKGEALPANFATIRLDLQTGRIQTFRP